MKALIAGHSLKDSGAVSGINKENDLTILVRDQVRDILVKQYHKDVIIDKDGDSLRVVIKDLKKLKLDSVLSIHFNAYNGKASGCEVLVRKNPNKYEKSKATQLSDLVSKTLHIKNRKVKSESHTPHRRLGILHTATNCMLLEICFLDNPSDMKKFDTNFYSLCLELARFVNNL